MKDVARSRPPILHTLLGWAVVVAVVVVLTPASVAAGDPAGTPFGNFESAVVHDDGSVELTGWTIDPDRFRSIYVWVTVDGVGRHVLADEPRADVAAVYSMFGGSGFDVVVEPAPGSRTICVTASNVGPGQHKLLGCRTVEVPRLDPFGNLERAKAVAGGIEVSGWAIDPDVTDPIYVWVTVDGVGRHLFADHNRSDLGVAFPEHGPAHGFSGTLAAGPGRHRVCATASNVSFGEHTPLGCRSVVLPDPHAPYGNFEKATYWMFFDGGGGARGGLGISIEGWAIDPDTTGPIFVWVTVDGVGRHLLADKNRPDVAAAFPGFGLQHGFAADLEIPHGWHTVCVTASNVGLGQHTNLGCRTVNVIP